MNTPGAGGRSGAGALLYAECDVDATREPKARKRLPAFGRQLKAALEAGLRPRKAGGGIIVTSEWGYAQAFDPGRVVCPPGDAVEQFDLSFLCGCEVLVLVPERDERYGEALVARIRDAGASLVVLAVNREDSP